MKPAPFDYVAASSVAEAAAARAEAEYSVLLAGGQSLIPTMNFRLAQPDVVIDLSRVSELCNLEVDDSWVRVGAMVTQQTAELDPAVRAANPLIAETLRNVAHPAIRSRGTVTGSIAHADGAAELPALLTTLDGEVTAVSATGTRTISAGDLFEFHLTTTLEEDELISEVRFPVMASGTGYAFDEFARRHGDFALAGVAVVVTLNEGVCESAAIGACGIGSRPIRLRDAETALVGGTFTDDQVTSAQDASRAYVTTETDMTTTQAYRRHLLAGIVGRTVRTAAARARGEE